MAYSASIRSVLGCSGEAQELLWYYQGLSAD